LSRAPVDRAAADPRTERLDAERPSLEDHLEFVVGLSGDPEVARWQWPGELGGPRTPAQARELLDDKIEHWDRHGFGQWIWRERAGGEPVGRIGLQWTTSPGELAVEVGWSVVRSKQGRGYATEAGLAALRYGFEQAGCERIVSFTWTENLASLRVMEKLGMQRRREFELEGLPHLLYEATPQA
jgi:[ribosomal protein S5]-alanine N-acetyltransferase